MVPRRRLKDRCIGPMAKRWFAPTARSNWPTPRLQHDLPLQEARPPPRGLRFRRRRSSSSPPSPSSHHRFHRHLLPLRRELLRGGSRQSPHLLRSRSRQRLRLRCRRLPCRPRLQLRQRLPQRRSLLRARLSLHPAHLLRRGGRQLLWVRRRRLRCRHPCRLPGMRRPSPKLLGRDLPRDRSRRARGLAVSSC